MKDQLHKLMEAEGMSPAKFADAIGVQRSSISHIISGRNKPSYDFIMKILGRFKGINAEWLLTGQGSMIKGQNVSPDKDLDTRNLFNTDRHDKEIVKSHTSPADPPTHSYSSTKETLETDTSFSAVKEVGKSVKNEFTNVNYVKYILVFYRDGSFEQYNPRE